MSHGFRVASLLATTLAASVGAMALVPSISLAGGLEIPENGVVALGRGGAMVARTSDPTALMHNVAGIVGLPGVQLTLSTNLGLFHHCFQRAGRYPTETETTVENRGTVFAESMYAGMAYPRVCKEPGVSPGPQVLATFRLDPRIAVGVGLYAPSTVGYRQVFPDRVSTPGGLAPSPVRHMVFDETLLVLYPTFAIAVAPVSWFRVGAALQPSFARFELGSLANSVTGNAQSPYSDLRIDVDASGWFLAGQLGVQVVPSPYFSFGIQARYHQPSDLSGRARVTANYYHRDPMRDPDAMRRVNSSFEVVRMRLQLPWNVRAGVRFVLPRRYAHAQTYQGVGRPYDPMRDDVFDIELVGIYEATSVLSETTLENRGQIDLGDIQAVAPSPLRIRQDFRDVVGVRLGGDYNLLPGVFALRAGVAYETGAMSNEWAQIHIPSYDTLSVHTGLSFRWRWLTATVAYGHYFMRDFEADRGMRSIVGTMGPLTEMDCRGLAGASACQINRGRYSASMDMFGVGVTAAF